MYGRGEREEKPGQGEYRRFTHEAIPFFLLVSGGLEARPIGVVIMQAAGRLPKLAAFAGESSE